MNEIVMLVIGCGALIGGSDRICGNRLNLGCKFDEGFSLLGPMALSMAGIICIAPFLSSIMSYTISPVFHLLGIDPAMAGSILAIDMGGYPLAMNLAKSQQIGAFSGIIAASMFGCTIVFTIPVGMKVLPKNDQSLFLKGISAGIVCMPAGLLAGGIVQGLPLLTVIHQSLPIIFLSAIILYGLIRHTDASIHLFSSFASLIQIFATAGLTITAFQHITGITVFPSLIPLPEAMETVVSIGIVMLGSLPTAELLRRMLSRPLSWIGRKTGMNDAATTGIIVGCITVMPSLVMMKDMNPKGKIMCSCFLVCGAAILGAHLGFAAGTQPDLITPLLAGKAVGAAISMAVAHKICKPSGI